MTSLERVARFLGDKHIVDGGRIERAYEYIGAGYTSTRHAPMSDADLLLALLEQSAALGLFTQLEHGDFDDAKNVWIADIHNGQGIGPTPLAAMIKAVEKYEEGK